MYALGLVGGNLLRGYGIKSQAITANFVQHLRYSLYRIKYSSNLSVHFVLLRLRDIHLGSSRIEHAKTKQLPKNTIRFNRICFIGTKPSRARTISARSTVLHE